MRIVMTIFYLVLVVFGASFAALNAKSIEVNFYFTTLNMPISVVMAMMMGIGILIGLLLFLGRYWRLKSEHRKLRNQLRLTEKEIQNLRTIPLRD